MESSIAGFLAVGQTNIMLYKQWGVSSAVWKGLTLHICNWCHVEHMIFVWEKESMWQHDEIQTDLQKTELEDGKVLDWVNILTRGDQKVWLTLQSTGRSRLGMKHGLICSRFLPYCSGSIAGGETLDAGRTYTWNSPLTFPADVLAVSHSCYFKCFYINNICLWCDPYNLSGSFLTPIITVRHSNGLLLKIVLTIFTDVSE